MTESAASPLVSIILATYNSATHLAEAIESILRQTYTHLELVVVDDGSTDGTAAVLASFRDPRIILVRHPTTRAFSRHGAPSSDSSGVMTPGSLKSWLHR
jgi:glycosyltransferase involved in cell wall biosynthesis